MELLYTDNRIVVCLKPAGVLSTDEPGGMPELLRRALGEDETGCVRVVHRLDRPVGGVMVYARSRMADSILSRQVQAHTFEKDYLAVLEEFRTRRRAFLPIFLRATRQQNAPSSRTPPARTRGLPGFHIGCLA
ncbi:MAG: pseudouridine synthase [Oscillospiraceae bacterium]